MISFILTWNCHHNKKITSHHSLCPLWLFLSYLTSEMGAVILKQKCMDQVSEVISYNQWSYLYIISVFIELSWLFVKPKLQKQWEKKSQLVMVCSGDGKSKLCLELPRMSKLIRSTCPYLYMMYLCIVSYFLEPPVGECGQTALYLSGYCGVCNRDLIDPRWRSLVPVYLVS